MLKSPSVKSLLRFKKDCKSWNTMISDPAFIRKHLKKWKNALNTNNLFLSKFKNPCRTSKGEYSLHLRHYSMRMQHRATREGISVLHKKARVVESVYTKRD
ncbi:hypothetical protein MIMGU_mgv1a026658mg, partial [Erythranthe guttata]